MTYKNYTTNIYSVNYIDRAVCICARNKPEAQEIIKAINSKLKNNQNKIKLDKKQIDRKTHKSDSLTPEKLFTQVDLFLNHQDWYIIK